MGKRKKKEKRWREISCDACEAVCCRHVATQIDEPTRKRDYDNIRWYLLHQNVAVFIDHDGDWFLEFETPCAELGPDHRCGKYEERPRLCREYGVDDGLCEFHAEEDPHTIRFSTAREFERYLEKRGVKWRWKRMSG